MGQSTTSQNISSLDFTLQRQLPNGSIVKENNGRLHFLKEYTFTNQQAYQQAFVNFSKKLPEKHEHILYLERTNTKLENTFCSTFFKISLLYEYLDHTLQKEIQKRIQERKIFDQKQVWSVLCSCTLAVSQMIRFQGRSHSALKTKDLRLTQEGVVKILSLEMIGMDADQDANQQGTVKQLAITILNCILMDHISNDSQFYLNELIDNLESSSEMKNILRLMMNPRMKFVELEDYLFKLVQEDTDSLNSYSHTPIVKDKVFKNNSYSKIPQQSKDDDNLFNMPKDMEDNPQMKPFQPKTQEQQVPDQNDVVDQSKERIQNSGQSTLRQKNSFSPSSQRQQPEPHYHKPEYTYNRNENSLFTDPKLLNLIHSNLQQINKRKSITNSRKLGGTQSKTSLQHKESKTLLHSDSNTKVNPSSHCIQENNTFINRQSNLSLNQIMNKDQNTIPLLNNSSVRSTSKKENSNSTVSIKQDQKQSRSCNMIVIPNNGSESQQLTFKSQKEVVSEYKCNPQDKKKMQEGSYDNIMDIKDMGFKKNKNIKIQEQIRQSKQPKEQMHHVYNNQTFSQQTSSNNSFNYNTMEHTSNSETNALPFYNQTSKTNKSTKNNIMYSINEPKDEFQYVTQTYLRGKYEGTKLNNMRHGTGVFYYIQGGKYIGQWKENKMNGKGVLYYPDNSIAYDGEWKDDQLSGHGTLYNEEVTEFKGPCDYKSWKDLDLYFVKYEGQFKEDSKNGEGKLFLSNGQIFQGHFREDLVWGQGLLLKQDGSKIRGIWRQNRLIKLF